MSQRGTPSAGEQFAGAQYPQANYQNLAQVVSQVAAEAARAAFQASQGQPHGAASHQQAQRTSLHGAQPSHGSLQRTQGGVVQASGQAGVQSQPQSSLLGAQSPQPSGQQQAQNRTQQQDRFFPAVDVIETAKEVRVYADLPGVNSQSIQIEALDNTIMLSAERIDNDAEIEEGTSVMRERGAVMERTLQIPKPIDVDGAEATWDQGVVTITLPKKDSENKREIGVQ